MNKDKKPLSITHPEIAAQAYGWDPNNVLSGTHKKLKWQCSKGHIWEAACVSRSKGHGCPICSGRTVQVGFNDLATTNPDLAQEADGWDPRTVVAGTHKKLKWRCSKGHKWVVAGEQRLTRKSGCPICANRKVLEGFNDLATTNPDLAQEADGWDPRTVVAGTSKQLTWRCTEGHTWRATGNSRVFNRNKGNGCPSCAISAFDPSADAYVYFLINNRWEIYQIGITNNPKVRLKRHAKNGFEVLDLRGPIKGYIAREIEVSLLKYLKNQKARLSPEHIAGKFDGYSESWTIDSFKVNNLKELIDKASEAGF